jgi:hypothetical protein
MSAAQKQPSGGQLLALPAQKRNIGKRPMAASPLERNPKKKLIV